MKTADSATHVVLGTLKQHTAAFGELSGLTAREITNITQFDGRIVAAVVNTLVRQGRARVVDKRPRKTLYGFVCWDTAGATSLIEIPPCELERLWKGVPDAIALAKLMGRAVRALVPDDYAWIGVQEDAQRRTPRSEGMGAHIHDGEQSPRTAGFWRGPPPDKSSATRSGEPALAEHRAGESAANSYWGEELSTDT